ncbi:TetR/AcrR family transcriptional regulator [Paeniglutamicibacter terrestris]|uniref:TetR/AcrR family transcriptional regulator n=1 Tax=Paeniglutamicibacter terrestris TaxID=2723403 RepID=A0ABX1G1S2_9MICC|nr:TetR/AcrR family transcriptional regulator [Paeniglutamicibacter terrestris]NKG20185.1 TetR/AcrR family transcriptional regulator [Paeniglutamicibacter terrestris]
MPVEPQPLGRRERNKQAKLERITAAASQLFAEYGVDEVTTQQIADAADIGTGTLFLYAKTKGELLLLVQNLHYAAALERGRAAVADTETALDGMLALIAEVVDCNRVQVENGRTYLREMVFGDPSEPHHAEALSIVAQTQQAVAEILVERAQVAAPEAATLAGVVSAIMFMDLAASVNVGASNQEILAQIRTQLAAILPR